VIDLHLHTTASDGASTPAGLVAEARAAGLSTIAVTDHDTTAAIDEVVRHAGTGLDVVPGIEITAVESGRDVHVLGYFIDPTSPELQAFLESLVERDRELPRDLGQCGGRLGRSLWLGRLTAGRDHDHREQDEDDGRPHERCDTAGPRTVAYGSHSQAYSCVASSK